MISMVITQGAESITHLLFWLVWGFELATLQYPVSRLAPPFFFFGWKLKHTVEIQNETGTSTWCFTYQNVFYGAVCTSLLLHSESSVDTHLLKRLLSPPIPHEQKLSDTSAQRETNTNKQTNTGKKQLEVAYSGGQCHSKWCAGKHGFKENKVYL